MGFFSWRAYILANHRGALAWLLDGRRSPDVLGPDACFSYEYVRTCYMVAYDSIPPLPRLCSEGASAAAHHFGSAQACAFAQRPSNAILRPVVVG